MKKNRVMRAASAILVLAILTTCIFSGTMAKYIISDNTTDSARVAKFGVVVTASGDLFGQSYNAGYTENTAGVVQAWSEHNPTVAVNTTDQGDKINVVAPGTRNDKGVTFAVNGTPEVSTEVIVDAPEGDANNGFDDDADLTNTDIYLKSGKYAIMVAVSSDTVEITTDNAADFYSYNSSAKTFAQLAAKPVTTTIIYKKVMPTTVAADYYPIKWTVKDVIGGTTVLNAAQGAALMGDATTTGSVAKAIKDALTIADNTPNTPINTKVNVTWKWDYSDAVNATDPGAWLDAASDVVLPNWENTTQIDLQDTLLGQMIATGADATTTGGVGSLGTYKIAKDVSDTLTEVQYKVINANGSSGTAAANTTIVAYTDSLNSAATWKDADVACLTVSFGARVTVAQVD